MSCCRLSNACINNIDEEFGSHFWSAGIDIIDVALYCLAVNLGSHLGVLSIYLSICLIVSELQEVWREGPGQLLVGTGDLGCNRGRDGCAPAPRRGRAISTTPFKNSAVSALAL
jgi:hypothetical protein